MKGYQEKIAPFKALDETVKVEEQVEKIIASLQFRSAKQMRNFFIFVVQQVLTGQSHRIKQYTIAVEALNLATDFDPDINPYVRVIGGRVRARLLAYYQGDGANDSITISLPKGSYQPLIKTKNINTSMIKKQMDMPVKNKDLSYYVLMS